MRPCRPVYLALLLPLVVAISFNCVRMSYEFRWKSELLVITDHTMHDLAIFQILIGAYVFATMCFQVFVVLTRCTKLLKYSVFGQQTAVYISILIMIFLLASRFPSLKEDKAMLNNAMSRYGKDGNMNRMLDTTQSLLKCCGVNGHTNWKQVNTTYTADALIFEVEQKFVERVPKSCTTISEASVQLHTRGCLPSLFAFKELTAYCLALNVCLLILLEVIIFCLMDAITADFSESDAEPKAKHRWGDDVYTVCIWYEPTTTLGA